MIPDIVGRNEAFLLHGAGKSLARKSPLSSPDGAPEFFQQAHFRELAIERATKDQTAFDLAATGLAQYFFKLKTEFSAQQKQKIDGFMTESCEEPLGTKTTSASH